MGGFKNIVSVIVFCLLCASSVSAAVYQGQRMVATGRAVFNPMQVVPAEQIPATQGEVVYADDTMVPLINANACSKDSQCETNSVKVGNPGTTPSYGDISTSGIIKTYGGLSVLGGYLNLPQNSVQEEDIMFTTYCGPEDSLYIMGGDLQCGPGGGQGCQCLYWLDADLGVKQAIDNGDTITISGGPGIVTNVYTPENISVSILPDGIKTYMVEDEQITSEKIHWNTIRSEDIEDQAINSPKIRSNAVTSDKVVDGTISPADVGFNYAGSSSKGGPATSAYSVPWTGITGMPAGFADGIDDVGSGGSFYFTLDGDLGPMETVYNGDTLGVRGGEGIITEVLTPDNVSISIIPGGIDNNLLGQNAVTSNKIADGTITYSDINTASVQRRVTGSCPSGSSIRIINPDGTVACETDDSGSGGGVVAGDGLSGSGTAMDPLVVNAGSGIYVDGAGVSATLGTAISSSEIMDGTVATQDIMNGAVTQTKLNLGLSGSGNAYVCVNSAGQLYRSQTPCV